MIILRVRVTTCNYVIYYMYYVVYFVLCEYATIILPSITGHHSVKSC